MADLPCCKRDESGDWNDLCICGHRFGAHRSGHPHNCLDDLLLGTNAHRYRCAGGCEAFVLNSPFGILLRDLKSEETS